MKILGHPITDIFSTRKLIFSKLIQRILLTHILNYFVFFANSGLDYVAHEDVLPYKTSEKLPISNHLFDKFLALDSSSGKQIIIN